MLDVTRLRVLAAVARHGSVTAAAKSLNYAQPSVSHHLARLEAAEHELAAHVGQREERIRVAGFPSALATMVPAAAARLRSEYPGVELLLAEAEPQAALRMLRAGRVDVALVFSYVQQGTVTGHPEDEERVQARLLLDEPVHLV